MGARDEHAASASRAVPPGPHSLLIALVFLGASMAVGDVIVRVTESGFATLLREGLLIGAWVAMWRPLEVFLYDWWPILGEVRLLERLSRMPVRIEYDTARSGDAWRSDWPEAPTFPSLVSTPGLPSGGAISS